MKKRSIIFTAIIIAIVLIIGYMLYKMPLPNQSKAQNGQLNAMATIYVKDITSNNFNVWNGEAFGQANPLQANEGLRVILPAGEYYVKIDAQGYNSITSLIANLSEQSIVTANINLGGKNMLGEKILSLVSTSDKMNNFPLIVTPLPQISLLPVGEYLPRITAYGKDSEMISVFDKAYDKPVVIYVFSSWNDNAQEQMQIFTDLRNEYKDEIIFYALTTLEPLKINQARNLRGDYGIEIYKPSDAFFNDYKISTLPEFIFATNRGELLSLVIGSKSAEQLRSIIKELYNK